MSDTTAKVKGAKVGKVVSDAMNKTVVVLVERTVTHKLYKKILRRSKKYSVHDENNSCHAGDTVMIKEVKPISKTKKWEIVQILEKAQA